MVTTMFERPATTHIRCPKCRSNNLLFIESGTWTGTWEVRDGKLDRDQGFHHPESVDRIDVKCVECDHSWKPRGAWQVDDICKEEGVPEDDE